MRFQTRTQCTTLAISDRRKNEKNRDNKGVFAAVFIDLFKAFDCIPQGWLKAKLNAFGFDNKSLSVISAFSRTEVGPIFSLLYL